MSDFFGKLKSGAGKVAFEADKLAQVNRAKNELDQLNRGLTELFAELGKAAYQQALNNEPVILGDFVQKIEDQKKKVAAKESELQAINAKVYTQPGAPQPAAPQPAAYTPPPPPPAPAAAAPVDEEPPAPATKFCSNCGAEVSAGVKFCTECGSRV